MLYDNLAVNELGHLTVNGHDTTKLAKEYGAPLYVLDEDRIRARCRQYRETMTKAFGGTSGPLYASKALSFKEMYRIMGEESMRVDVVSPGELYTAVQAGFPAEKVFFHGNNKTDEDIAFALDMGLGYFVVDNYNELASIDAQAAQRGIRQKILLRLSPGIDSHTFAAINTGKIDCQFGAPIETGQAEVFVRSALSFEHLQLDGFHCHIGSQIFEWTPFRDAAEIMLSFMAEMKERYGFEAKVLNVGGGFGVPYTETDPKVDVTDNILRLGEFMHKRAEELQLKWPEILMEPGRSIVADSGITLYRVGGIKEVAGYRNYVTVNGGMTDNPRYALYQSAYTVVSADQANKEPDYLCTLTGRCCESGDRIQENIMLPKPEKGSLVAVLSTGAYNFSMSSNYNRLLRPAVVMVKKGSHRLVVRRQSFEDLVNCDL